MKQDLELRGRIKEILKVVQTYHPVIQLNFGSRHTLQFSAFLAQYIEGERHLMWLK